jgi:hypothetical protein
MCDKSHLPWEPEQSRRFRSFWICPECGEVNAWCHNDAIRFEKRTGRVCHVSTGSAFDNICGKCRADIVKPDSPINTPCYTHLED